MRDMVQNHMMQLLTLIAMEPPSALEANAIRDEKVKVLRSLLPLREEEVREHTIRAQYTSGAHNDVTVPGFLEEEGVAPDSRTESYVAMRVQVDNWRYGPVFLSCCVLESDFTKGSARSLSSSKRPLHFSAKTATPTSACSRIAQLNQL